MSRQTSKSIFGASKNIMRDGLHFVNVTVKVVKTVAIADANGYLKVLAGTILTEAGARMTAADANASSAYGVVYEDVDFDDTAVGGNEGVPVVIHGVVLIAELPVAPTTLQKAAMPNIKFVV